MTTTIATTTNITDEKSFIYFHRCNLKKKIFVSDLFCFPARFFPSSSIFECQVLTTSFFRKTFFCYNKTLIQFLLCEYRIHILIGPYGLCVWEKVEKSFVISRKLCLHGVGMHYFARENNHYDYCYYYKPVINSNNKRRTLRSQKRKEDSLYIRITQKTCFFKLIFCFMTGNNHNHNH